MTSTQPIAATAAAPVAAPDRLSAAVSAWRARHDRTAHPAGKFDRGGRWYPAEAEACPCCNAIRTPSRAWPLSLNKHCRSVEHVAALYGVDARELRRAIRAAA